jgi:hypothetical protein
MECQENSSKDTLRISQIHRYCRYAKKTQISLDPKKYRYVGEICNAQAQLRFSTAKTSSAARCWPFAKNPS